MAAIQWSGGKMRSSIEAKSSMMHDDKEQRLLHGHNNPDIDLTKTPQNFSYRGLDYYEKSARYDQLMSEVKVKRKSTGKNANVTLQKLVICVPAEMQDQDRFDPDQVKAWMTDVGEILDRHFGKLLIDMDVHCDEIHPYSDPTKSPGDPGYVVWSRVHAHAALVPGVYTTVLDSEKNPVRDENGQVKKELVLNAKKFSSRENIMKLNEEIQQMTAEKYHMRFMDGSGKGKKHSSVEELKMMTAEQLQADGYRLATKEQQIKTEQETLEKEIERQQSKLDEQKKAVIDKYTDAEEKDRHARNSLSESKQIEDTLRNLCCALTGKPIDSQMDTQTLVMRSMRDFRQIAEEKAARDAARKYAEDYQVMKEREQAAEEVLQSNEDLKIKVDTDQSRRHFMEMNTAKDGLTLEEHYQKFVQQGNKNIDMAKQRRDAAARNFQKPRRLPRTPDDIPEPEDDLEEVTMGRY